MKQEVDAARAAGESLGGWFNVVASGLVPGIGGYAEAAQRLDGRIAGALMSIPAIKGVQIGLGFEAATLPGSKVHDPIVMGSDAAGRIQPVRATNNAGGVEGGMTNGETLVASCAMKPIPTLARPLATVDLISGERREASKERSDVVAVPAAAVVGEAELAMVLANAYCEKFGGDALADSLSAFEHYVARLRAGR
jgi:chorismate synthase